MTVIIHAEKERCLILKLGNVEWPRQLCEESVS